MPELKPGDRVYVTDPGLAELRRIMRQVTGQEPTPNHHGTVHEASSVSVLIYFDNEDGPGQGNAAPYPPHEVRLLSDGGGHA